jgi:4-amino-4-deoxy-L-arabinose transferase-like glycosyltransferase
MTRKAFFKLLPLLFLYFGVLFFFVRGTLDFGDESRYAMYAENLTKGFYSPPDTLFLWNGPGYPLLLTPFAFFDIPWIYAKMLNPLFFFLAVCFFYSAVRGFASERPALFFAYLFGLYPPFYAELWLLLTEPFTLMLVTLFALLIAKWFQTAKLRFMFSAAIVCGYIALTKVFFGYVITAVLLMSLVLAFWSRTARRTLPIYAMALLLCVPYLAYTYRLTGKVFYWSTAGGELVYWLYTPYPDEFGSWKSDVDVATDPALAHHRPFYKELEGLNFVKRDERFKKKALENIIGNPRQVILNYAANLGRLFLNFPFSYKYQHPRTLFYMTPNCLLLAAIVFNLYPLIKLRSYLPAFIIHACIVSVVYICGHSLVAAMSRFLCTVLPFVFLVIAYVATNLIQLRIPENIVEGSA